jgi:hypothetical protein
MPIRLSVARVRKVSFAFAFGYRFEKGGDGLTLSMFQHTDINAAVIELTIKNRGRRPEQIKRVEFTTNGQWDIPNDSIWANPEPVFDRLRGESYIKVSNEVGSKANKAIGKALEPHKKLTVTFFLTTDHSPSPEVGVFPFHLGCELIYGADQRLRLPDIVVSLHGQAIKSYHQYEVAVGGKQVRLAHAPTRF